VTLGARRRRLDIPEVGVVVFPGSCDEADAHRAIERTLGLRARYLWHADRDIGGVEAVVIPGGFSYGDYLRPGAIARFSPVMESVVEFARGGGPVLGICNGFQVLCEAGLLPGALLTNESLRFVCRQVDVLVERTDSPFTSACEPGEALSLPVKHTTGRYFAPPEMLDELEASGRIVLRYARGANPNGSLRDVAAVVNEDRNVLGLMPHPEHAVDSLTGSTGGARLFHSLARHLAAVAA
jgi:phosphoribosylformylglycinamidine synthase I